MLTRKTSPVSDALREQPRGQWMSSAPSERDAIATQDTGRMPAVARFSGSLGDLAVADLIQIMQLLGKSALISVTRDGAESRIWCSEGELVDAESGAARAEAALFRILSFEQGWLMAELRPVSRSRTIFGSSQQLLLEAAQRKDEAARHAEPVESLSLDADFDDETRPINAELAQVAQQVAQFSGDTPHPGQAASLAPIVAQPRSSERTRAARGFAAWIGLAALLLIPGAYLLGARSAPAPAPLKEVVHAASAARAQRYDVVLRVEPASAEIWLDGKLVATGHVEASAQRDGTSHELKVVAPGYVPATVFFADAAPPAELRLERLPEPAPRPASALAAPVREALAGAAPARDATAAPSPLHPPTVSGTSGERAKAPSAARARANEPRVRVIGEEEPRVRVLD